MYDIKTENVFIFPFFNILHSLMSQLFHTFEQLVYMFHLIRSIFLSISLALFYFVTMETDFSKPIAKLSNLHTW